VNPVLVIGTLIVEAIIIFGVSAAVAFTQKHRQTAAEFATTGRSMPMIAIAATQALTALGGGHILGMPGASWSFGAGVIWYIIASGVCMIILLTFTGPWERRLGYSTINQLF
jgi:Na+/proline symporter